jgi:hypothetical protein
MCCGSGHCIFWYMVMNVLEEFSGLLFTAHWKMEAVCDDGKPQYPPVRLYSPITHNILHFPCIIPLFITNQINALIRHEICHIILHHILI